VIPLRDLVPTNTRPVVTYVLIGLNIAVYLFGLLLGTDDSERLMLRFGLVPAIMTGSSIFVPNSLGGAAGALVTPFTSMFLHGGLLHVAGNMWFLWVFGDNVEEAVGRFRYVVFYLVTGLCAALLQVISAPDSAVPMVGASGAVSGILAGYVVLHPRAPVRTLVPIFVFFTTFDIPAFWFVFVWFGLQLANALMSLGPIDYEGGVAWWAHVGGFIAGIVLIKLFVPTRAPAWEHSRAAQRRPHDPRRDPDW
jgi:membrane associated rhomboid family serine protease